MSTPDNNPDPQRPTPDDNPYSGHAAPGSQPQYGQPQYGQNASGAQQPGGQQPYGYQSPQASGYNYPGSAAEMPAADKGPAPKQVEMAYWLILAAGALTLISAIISMTTVSDISGAGPGLAAAAGVVGMIIAVVFTAIYVLLAIFIRKGHNWARITATVLAAINVVLVIFNLISLAIISSASSDMYAGAAVNPFSTILDVIVMVLGVIAVVLIWMKPARPYFQAPRPAGYTAY